MGDWECNGSDTVGIVQGIPQVTRSGSCATATPPAPHRDFAYYDRGVSGDHPETHIPIVGDWDGDGRDGPGVMRASGTVSPQWLLRNDPSAGFADHVFHYGAGHMEAPLAWR